MREAGLEFYTTQELIDELMHRTTFLGVVVQAEGEYRNQAWQGERMFRVHFNHNLEGVEVRLLLDAIVQRLGEREC